MKNLLKIKILALFSIAMVFTSCDKDEDLEPITGEALFSYELNGYEVAFTNLSDVSGDVTYAWDFDDGIGASVEKDPVYSYVAKGEYTISLTVTDSEGGTHFVSTKIVIDKSTVVMLDDASVDDWASIAEAFTPGANAGIVKSFKYDYDKDNIYFYVKTDAGADQISQIFDMAIDLDPSSVTGYPFDLWPNYGGGELLIEGNFMVDRTSDEYWISAALWNVDGTEWLEGDTDADIWQIFKIDQKGVTDGSIAIANGIIEFEFSISRTIITQLVGVDQITVTAWASDADWEEVGWIPDMNPSDNSNPDAEGIAIDMR